MVLLVAQATRQRFAAAKTGTALMRADRAVHVSLPSALCIIAVDVIQCLG